MTEHRKDGWQGFNVNVPQFIRELRDHKEYSAAVCLELVWQNKLRLWAALSLAQTYIKDSHLAHAVVDLSGDGPRTSQHTLIHAIDQALAGTEKLELCHCSLSGDVHVVRDGKCCEVCEGKREAFTPENVEMALKFLAERPPRQVKLEDVARAFYEGCAAASPVKFPGSPPPPSWDSGGEEAANGRAVFIAGAKRALELLGRKE